MNYRSEKEELIVTVLRKFVIPLGFGMETSRALEIALESKEMEHAEAVGFIRKESIRKAMDKIEKGGTLGDVLNELGIFSEYDIQILDLGAECGSTEKACEALIDFYAVTYGV